MHCSDGHGRTFMLIEAVTVFLALIGTTLSCMNTGARVTYAMGKDNEVPEHFGMLHEKNLSPHRAIWALAIISAVIGCIALVMLFGDGGALPDATIQGPAAGFWSSFGYVSHDTMAKLPNSLLTITLASNFGTFLLYMLSCVTCIFCYTGHPNFSFVRHTAHPVFRHSREPGLHGQPTSCCRSWDTAPRWNRSLPWGSRQSGPSTAAFTSFDPAKPGPHNAGHQPYVMV